MADSCPRPGSVKGMHPSRACRRQEILSLLFLILPEMGNLRPGEADVLAVFLLPSLLLMTLRGFFSEVRNFVWPERSEEIVT